MTDSKRNPYVEPQAEIIRVNMQMCIMSGNSTIIDPVGEEEDPKY